MLLQSLLRRLIPHKIMLIAITLASALCLVLAGCGSKDSKSPASSGEVHDHDHDSQAGHSHDDGHDHDHAEDHEGHEGHDHAEGEDHDQNHDSQPGHDHEDGHEHDHTTTGTAHDETPGQDHDDGHEHDHADDHTTGTAHEGAEAAGHEGHDHAHEGASVAIPAQVRENLGITFAKVELRNVDSTLRMPGRFEVRPSAMREYHAPLAGRIELLVDQYEYLTTGTPLYRLDSREWRNMQQEFLTVEAEVAATSASLMSAQVARESGGSAEDVTRNRIAAAEAHIESLAASIKVAEERERQVMRLQEIVGGRLSDINEARSQLAGLRNELSQAREDRVELEQQRLQLSTEGGGGAFGTTETLLASQTARRAEYTAARARRDLLKASMLSIAGLPVTDENHTSTTWTISPEVTVRAGAEGVVGTIDATSGGYVDSSAEILSTVNPTALRFRAIALQSDILRLQNEMPGRILRPGNAASDLPGDSIPVTAKLALEADPEKRTLDLVADVNALYPWARTGVSTDIELLLSSDEKPLPAIPASAVIQDGLDKVFFLRDPHNPDQAERVKASLGVSDGHWIQLKSGVKPGDEVVLDGVYELKLATAAAPEKAGHFHADGTFHEGED